eukprot:5234814-Prymnesium_polylepis.1
MLGPYLFDSSRARSILRQTRLKRQYEELRVRAPLTYRQLLPEVARLEACFVMQHDSNRRALEGAVVCAVGLQ